MTREGEARSVAQRLVVRLFDDSNVDHWSFRKSRSLLQSVTHVPGMDRPASLVLASSRPVVTREINWVGALIWIARALCAGLYCNENWIGLGVGGAIAGWVECTNIRYSNDLSAILRAGGLNGLGGLAETGNSTSRPADYRPTFTPRDS